MVTKLFFHAAAYSGGGTVPINQTGGAAPALQGGLSLQTYGQPGADATSVSRSMNKTIGTNWTNFAITTIANTATHSYYITKFISDPLTAQTINANTWTFMTGIAETSFNVNLIGYVPVMLYVWRPSTGVLVGQLANNPTITGYAEPDEQGPANINKITFPQASNLAVQQGDVLILEIWNRFTQSSATAYQIGFYYDGPTDLSTSSTNDDATNIASFIETPQDLTFTTDPGGSPIDMDVTDTIVLVNKFITKV
ncbi:MAG: hypothetical protein L0H53_03870 [Candidatus Nitrosocosmicus sp.]|nr:hypothetical protein [Candidatus Nitrosocosmicus sp.]MDN5866236.1 hypothetical protein [Candidatus Nitrosocosmicus sp.]